MDSAFNDIAYEISELLSSQNHTDAITRLKDVQASWIKNSQFWSLLGQSYLCGEQTFEAEEAFAKAHALDPKFDTLFNLAECAFIRGDYHLAINGFREALATDPDSEAYRGITAFKILVCAVFNGESERHASGKIHESLTPTGSLFIKVLHAALNDDAILAANLLSSPEAQTADRTPYLDTLITSGVLAIENPEDALAHTTKRDGSNTTKLEALS